MKRRRVQPPRPAAPDLAQELATAPAKPRLTESVVDAGTTREVSKTSTERVRSLEALIRVCEIDTSVWEVERWICNKWEVGMKPPAVTAWVAGKNGRVPLFTRKTDKPIVEPLFQVKAWLKRKSPLTLTMERLRLELVADIRAEVKRAPAERRKPAFVANDWLFEFCANDIHFGKLAWGDETVTNYDTDIAESLVEAALEFLLERALKLTDGHLSRVLCLVGNDVAHFDAKSGETSSGTRMDADTRYIRVYRRICQVHRRAIDTLRRVAPVDVVVVPGNHDELTSFHLGEILATRYDGVKHVTVDNGPRLRKYFAYGTNLFGFTHGMIERVEELPLLMAREQPELWAQCPSREWHIGHKHIAEAHTFRRRSGKDAWLEQDLKSDKGVRVRRLASLSAHDFWHTQHAFVDRRVCDAFVFHRQAGFTDHLNFNVDHFSGKALVPK